MPFPFPRFRNAFNQNLNRAFAPIQQGAIRDAFALEASVKDVATVMDENATLTLDSGLVIPDIVAGIPYLFEMLLFVTATANGSIALNQAGGTAVASSYTGWTSFVTAAGAATTIIDVAALNTAQDPTNAAFVRVAHQAVGIFSSGGTYGIQWAQSDSHADETTVGLGSYITATPLTALYAR